MKSVLILTEAGTKFGYGHLMRCLAIAQGFKAENIDSTFYLRGDSNPDNILKEFIWYNQDWLIEDLDVTGSIVIVDSYYADEQFCNKVYKTAYKVLFIDDYNRIPYPGGFVLNSVIGADGIGYPDNSEINYLLGPKYHPLRKEFWEVPEKEIKENIETILITFGGSDITNETPRVLKLLNEYYPLLKKNVIIGSGFSNIDEIKKAADDKTCLIMQPDAEQMKKEMLDCDIAISAAGQTIYELARVGVPTIGLCVIENQLYNLSVWLKTKTFYFLNVIDDHYELPFIIKMMKSMNSRSARKKISNKTKGIIDSRSTLRVCELLQSGINAII